MENRHLWFSKPHLHHPRKLASAHTTVLQSWQLVLENQVGGESGVLAYREHVRERTDEAAAGVPVLARERWPYWMVRGDIKEMRVRARKGHTMGEYFRLDHNACKSIRICFIADILLKIHCVPRCSTTACLLGVLEYPGKETVVVV